MLARDPGSCQPPAPGDTVWCDWDVEVEGVVEEEQPFYLPLQDDEGNPLPIGPPWALRARREQDEQAGGEDGTPRGDAKRQRRSAAASTEPDLLGYAVVEEMVTPDGVAVACLLQEVGGLSGHALELQRLARGVMEASAKPAEDAGGGAAAAGGGGAAAQDPDPDFDL